MNFPKFYSEYFCFFYSHYKNKNRFKPTIFSFISTFENSLKISFNPYLVNLKKSFGASWILKINGVESKTTESLSIKL